MNTGAVAEVFHGKTDINNYTVSLLKSAAEGNIIGQKKLSELRDTFIAEFTECAEQYTLRASSSLSREIAQKIYDSVLFWTDVYLLSLGSDSAAMKTLVEIEPAELIVRGKKALLAVCEENRMIFKRAYNNRLKISVAAYRSAMEREFDEYYMNYSARFDARNAVAVIDYPLLGREAFELKAQGALFIREYYSSLEKENSFCLLFEDNAIERLLSAYGKMNMSPYNEMHFNICEVIMNNLLAALWLGKKVFDFSLCKDDISAFSSEVGKMKSVTEVSDRLEFLFACYESLIAEPGVYEYLKKYINSFSRAVFFRAENGGMNRFLTRV